MSKLPRSRRLVLLLILGAGAAYVALQGGRGKAPGTSGFADLANALRAKRLVGWEVVEAPDRPGPYRVADVPPPAFAGRGQPLVMNFRPAGGELRRFDLPASPDFEQAVVALETEGDKTPTFVVLRRAPPPAPPTAPKK